MKNEEWRDVTIPGYEHLYAVSNLGRVKSYDRIVRKGRGLPYHFQPERILANVIRNEYYCVSLCKKGKASLYRVNRLVALAFIPNADNKPEVNHIDGNKLNNHASNLEWNTPSENTKHAYETGLKVGKRGSQSHYAKLTENCVQYIREHFQKGSRWHPGNRNELADMFSVSPRTINDITCGRTWKHI